MTHYCTSSSISLHNYNVILCFNSKNYEFYNIIFLFSDVKTVCEIGFNAGHSTMLWLESNPNIHVYTFDINRWKYTEPMVRYLQFKYPGRLKEYFGDSLITVPKVAKQHGFHCNISIIDGGHFKDVPIRDIINMKSLSHEGTLLLIDDTSTGAESVDTVVNAIETLESADFLKRLFMCSRTGYRGFAALMYTWK